MQGSEPLGFLGKSSGGSETKEGYGLGLAFSEEWIYLCFCHTVKQPSSPKQTFHLWS